MVASAPGEMLLMLQLSDLNLIQEHMRTGVTVQMPVTGTGLE